MCALSKDGGGSDDAEAEVQRERRNVAREQTEGHFSVDEGRDTEKGGERDRYAAKGEEKEKTRPYVRKKKYALWPVIR